MFVYDGQSLVNAEVKALSDAIFSLIAMTSSVINDSRHGILSHTCSNVKSLKLSQYNGAEEIRKHMMLNTDGHLSQLLRELRTSMPMKDSEDRRKYAYLFIKQQSNELQQDQTLLELKRIAHKHFSKVHIIYIGKSIPSQLQEVVSEYHHTFDLHHTDTYSNVGNVVYQLSNDFCKS